MAKDFQLDDLDYRILEVLQRDAALSNVALARQVHSSPATCLRRARHLVKVGLIERQVAILAPGAIAPRLLAIVEVTLEAQGAEHLAEFEKRVAEDGAVRQCYRVSQGPDFVLLVETGDMPEYQSWTHRLLTARANVRNVRSFFVVSRSKFETRTALPARPA